MPGDEHRSAVDYLRMAAPIVDTPKNLGGAYDAAKSYLSGSPAAASAAQGAAVRAGSALAGPGAVAATEYLTQKPSLGALGGGGAPAAAPADGAAVGQNPWDNVYGTVQPGAMAPGAAGGGVQLSRPRLIGAHFDDSRIPLRKETQAQLFGALDNQKTQDATQDLAKVQANAAVASANILQEEADRAKVAHAERMHREEERAGFVRGQLDKARALNEEAQNASVDPGRFWRSPGAVLMSIGAVLSTNGEGMQALNRAQDMDLAQQREEIARKKGRGQAVENTLAKYQQAFGDERAAELAFEADSRDVARMKLMALAERSQSPQIMAQAKLIGAGLKEQADGKRAEFNARMDQFSYVAPQVVGVGGGAGAHPKPMEHLVNLPNGATLKMQTSDQAKEARDRIAAAEQIKVNNDRAIMLNRKWKDAMTSGHMLEAAQMKDELKSLQVTSAKLRSTALGQGQVKEGEMPLAIKEFPYLNLNPESEKGIRNNTNQVIQELGTWIHTSGAEQVQRGYGVDAAGRVTPTGEYVGHNVRPQNMDAAPKSFTPIAPQK